MGRNYRDGSDNVKNEACKSFCNHLVWFYREMKVRWGGWDSPPRRGAAPIGGGAGEGQTAWEQRISKAVNSAAFFLCGTWRTLRLCVWITRACFAGKITLAEARRTQRIRRGFSFEAINALERRYSDFDGKWCSEGRVR